MSEEINMVFTDESYIRALEEENKKLKRQIDLMQNDLKTKVSELNKLRTKKK